jgi:Fur family ferric uptake transcriptional regulator
VKSEVNQQARELLSSVKLRRTNPRVAVLGALLGAERPLTQDQISAELEGKAPDKVTIYRVLENFVRTGLVHRAFLHGRVWHFELANECTEEQCHPHFTCTNCGDTHCFTGVSMPMAKSPDEGFIIDRQRIQLEGSCPKCNPNTA